ncbi:MAG: ABC transporter permease [Bacteroidales bacterium]|nr:ABC transporter permease [Bacteroidales bacterium]MCL2132780.1 ABC transporter permease [Bacteroidales bacterium]
MLRKLLNKNISIPQLLGYVFAACAGMAIIFSAFCFSMDIRPLLSSERTGLFKPEFMVLNKRVPVVSMNIAAMAFSDAEVAELKQQSFVRSLSAFTPAQYTVQLYTDRNSAIPFATDAFFESVPDRLLGDAYSPWGWDIDLRLIPIIIPRDYLALYNFGFAGTQGLPLISEAVVQQVGFNVLLRGRGRIEEFQGRIAGFSDDLNTILVPEAFMLWANERFGDSRQPQQASRLILEVNNPADPQIAAFFASKENYEINSNKGEQGKLSYFLTLLILLLLAIGVLIMLPAIGLMLLSINLLVYKNQKTLGNLILLGYTRMRLARSYCLLVLFLNILTGLISVALAYIAQSWYMLKLAVFDLQQSVGFGRTLLFALLFVALVSILDIVWIHRKIRRIPTPARG